MTTPRPDGRKPPARRRPRAEPWRRIGETAAAAGVSPDTLRHYERRGVLPAARRTAAGYRLYPPETPRRVATIRRALLVGFSLSELADVLREREKGGAPCQRVRALVGRRLDDLDRRIAELTELRSDMRTMLKDWDRQLARTASGRQARLLERL